MTIAPGDRIPKGKLAVMTENGPGSISTDELFSGKKVVLFAVPGAFTPTCTLKHLPGFAEQAAAIKDKGVDTVACMAVNDIFVMSAWGKTIVPDGSILMLADGNADFAKALGLDTDASRFGMGVRSRRFSMIVDDGIVTKLNVDPGGEFTLSSAEVILQQLD
jgi:peroxiredoxin